MAILEIPVDGQVPDQKFTIELDKVIYTFRIRWNSRSGRFFLDIKTEDEVMIAAGICLVTNFPLLGSLTNPLLPKGDLFITDITEKFQEPTDENFGKTVFLLYNEAG